MAEGIIVSALTESRGTTSEMSRSEHRPTVHPQQGPLRPGEHRLKIRLRAAERRGERADELADEPVLRLAAVTRKTRPVGTRRHGARPVAGVCRGPCQVDESLSEHADSPFLPKALDRSG